MPCGASWHTPPTPTATRTHGRRGRPSKSLTPQNVDDVLTKTAPDRLHHYVVVSLLTGARTEELRALDWEHVHLDPEPLRTGVPPHIEVWRSVREGGDTKTRKSRRTLALPQRCVDALRTAARTTGGRATRRRRALAGHRTGVHDFARLRPWTRPTFGGTSAGRWPWSPGSIRPTGHPASSGTPSCRCSPMPACPRRDLAAGRPQRHDGHRAGLPAPAQAGLCRPARRSWTGCSTVDDGRA